MKIVLFAVVGVVGVVATPLVRAWLRLRRERAALCNPALDPGAESFDAEDRATFAELLALAHAPDLEAPPAVDFQVIADRLHRHAGEASVLHDAARALSGQPDSATKWSLFAEILLKATYSHNDVYWRGGLREAIFTVERALALASADEDAASIYALYLLRLGRVDEAAAWATGDHWRKRFVQSACARVRGQRERAAELLQACVPAAPPARRSSLENSLGALLGDLGRQEEALAAYTRATDANPNNAWAWHNRALVLDRLGRREDALAASERALSIGEFVAARTHNNALRRRLGSDRGPQPQA